MDTRTEEDGEREKSEGWKREEENERKENEGKRGI
jgi:hypothetical protein